jgi:hypothetical protein
MHDVLGAQGLTSQIVSVEIKTGSPYNYVGFAVKNWATSGAAYPKRIIDWDAGVDGSTPTTPTPGNDEAADASGEPGQGTSPNPPSNFGNHYIIKANGSYYDPSYGLGPFVDRKAYEDAAFAGGIRRTGVYPNFVYWLYALPASDNDPNTTTDLICTYSA